MYCAVYFQRSQGAVRDRDSIRKSPTVGDLRFECGFWDERPWRVVMRATLLKADGESYALPVLDRARVIGIRANGMLIEGEEVIPTRSTGIKNVKTRRFVQAWWCVPKRRPQGDAGSAQAESPPSV